MSAEDEAPIAEGSEMLRNLLRAVLTCGFVLCATSVSAATVDETNGLAEAINFTLRDANLLQNGSFELGLGSEPFYPGWETSDLIHVPTEHPPLPVIDKSEAHSGRQSLRLEMVKGTHKALLLIAPPLGVKEDEMYLFTFWLKTDCPQLKAFCQYSDHPQCLVRPCDKEDGWVRWYAHIKNGRPGRGLRLVFSNRAGKPFKLWVDDVCWQKIDGPPDLRKKPRPYLRAGNVEAVLLPTNRTELRFADRPMTVQWKMLAEKATRVKAQLFVCDLSRRTIGQKVNLGQQQLDEIPCGGTSDLGRLKRGTYLAVLAVRDAQSGAVLAVARERFAVLTDLRDVPAIDGFVCGTHEGLRSFRHTGYEFNWRGYWVPDEFFKLSYQTGIRMQRLYAKLDKLMPRKGEPDWYLDEYLRLSRKNKCHSMFVFPNWPERMEKKKFTTLQSREELKDGDWWFKEGQFVKEGRTGKVIIDVLEDHDDKARIVIAPPKTELLELCADVAKRWGDLLTCVEYMNEGNLRLYPKDYLRLVAEPIYPVMKKHAPELPLILGLNRNELHAREFFELGGWQYADGFNYHPYGGPSLMENAIPALRAYEKVAHDFKSKKRLHMGNSESFRQKSWQMAQRYLLDFSAGSSWSSGCTWDSAFAQEWARRNPSYNRGPFTPGRGAVAVNGMHRVLAGSKSLGRVDADPEDKTLVVLAEADGLYTVACAAANDTNRCALLKVDLSGLQYKCFDTWGEETVPRNDETVLTREILYFQSSAPRLHERFRRSKVQWKNKALSRRYTERHDVDEGITDQIRTGYYPSKRYGYPTTWRVMRRTDSAMALSQVATELPREGSEVRTRNQLNDITILPIDSRRRVKAPKFDLDDTVYLMCEVYHSQKEAVDMYWTSRGVGQVQMWLNGESVLGRKQFGGTHGEHWLKAEVGLLAGENVIMVRCKQERADAAFRVRLGDSPHQGYPVDRTDAPGMIALNGGDNGLIDNIKKIGSVGRGSWRRGPNLKEGETDVAVDFAFVDDGAYRINAVKFYSSNLTYPPVRWKVLGSNDGNRWSELCNMTIKNHREAVGRPFRFGNGRAFKRYRLLMTPMQRYKHLRLGEVDFLDYGEG
jgi:hypothetical protein